MQVMPRKIMNLPAILIACVLAPLSAGAATPVAPATAPVAATARVAEPVTASAPAAPALKAAAPSSASPATVSAPVLGGPRHDAPPSFMPANLVPGIESKENLVFPPAPDDPRIRFLSHFQKRDDFRKGKPGLWSRFVGFLMGRKGNDNSALSTPYGIAVSGIRAYVADTESAVVVVFDLTNGNTSILGSDAGDRLVSPVGLAVDSDANVYVTDSGQNVVAVYDSKGAFLRHIGKRGDLTRPTGIVYDPARKRILVADTGNSRIVAFKLDGTQEAVIGKAGSGEGAMGMPVNLALTAEGNIVVTDPLRCDIQIYSPDGAFQRQFGEQGNTPGYFNRPRGVAVDSDGNIHVVDAMFSNVQVFNQKGELLMFYGELGTKPGRFQLPAGISIDGSDRIFVVDALNHRVQVFQYLKKS